MSRLAHGRRPWLALAASLSLLASRVSAPAATVLDVAAGDQDVTVRGVDADDLFGNAVAAGDLNGDGVVDLVVGSNGGDGPTGTRSAAGEVAVVFGPFPTGTDRDLAALPANVVIYGEEAGDQFGFVVAVGDVTNDGAPDLIAGTVFSDGPGNTRSTAGEIRVFFGPLADGTVIDLATTPASVLIHGADVGDRLGSGATVGDVSGDGRGDLVISAFWADGLAFGNPTAGRVYALFAPLAPGVIDLAVPGSANARIVGKGGDSLGYRGLVVADVGGTPDLDLFIGAYTSRRPTGLRTEAGAAFAVFGPLADGSTLDLATTTADVQVYGADAGDELGIDVAVGSNGCEPVTTLVMGGHLSDGPGNARPRSGETSVLFGPFTSGTEIDLAVQPPDVTVYGADVDDFSGWSIDAADVTSDGHGDLVIGAPLADGPGEARLSGGEAYVVAGPLAAGTIDLATVPPHVLAYGAAAGDELGSEVLAADLSGDGKADLAATARRADSKGHAYGFYLDEPVGATEVSGVVWNDLNADGVRDPGEPGLFPVTVELYDAVGTLVDSTVTDLDGAYAFTGLPAGTYKVFEVNMAGWVSTTPDAVIVDAPCAIVDFGDTWPDGPHAPSLQTSLGIGGGGNLRIRVDEEVSLCFGIENTGDLESMVKLLAFTAAIEDSAVVAFTSATPDANWAVFRPTTMTTEFGTSTGTTTTERYAGFGLLTYLTATWDLPSSQVLEGQSGPLGDGMVKICFTVKGLAPGSSKVELSNRSSEDDPPTGAGRVLSDVTDERNLWSDDTTGLWYPVHNCFDPFDLDLANGYAWQNSSWDRHPTSNGYAKGTYSISVVP